MFDYSKNMHVFLLSRLSPHFTCYHGAAAIKGAKSVAATQFKSSNGNMLHVYCYGHALNLVVKDASFKVNCLRETFEAVREI